MEIESSFAQMLLKVGMFAIVQALIYIILTHSSSIFSKNITSRSHSFRYARSASVRRILAALSDLPAGSDPSPSSRGTQTQPSTIAQEEYSASGDDDLKKS